MGSFLKLMGGLGVVLASAGGVFAAGPVCVGTTNVVCTTIKGTMSLVSGPDPLQLSGATFTAVASIQAVGAPVNPGPTFTYNNVILQIGVSTQPGIPLACTPGATIVETASSSGDSFNVTSCPLLLGSSFVATVNLPGGTFPSPIPVPISSANLSPGGQVTYVCTLAQPICNGNTDPTTLTITSGTLAATCLGCTAVTLTPPTLPAFTGIAAGASSSQNVTVGPSSPLLSYALSTTTTSGGAWLTATPVGSEQTGGQFTVTANPATLGMGTYTGTVSVYTAASNSPQSIPITFNVSSQGFTLNPSTTTIPFVWVTGQATPTAPLSATTTPPMSVAYNAAVQPGASWLSVNPTSGTTGGAALTVSGNPTGLTGGTYNGSILLSATGATNSPSVAASLSVTTVAAAPLAPFSFVIGGSNPPSQTLTVTSSGPSTVTYSATATVLSPPGGNWLSVSSGTFTANSAGPMVSVNGASLPAGAATYTGTINVLPAGASTPIPVTVTLNVTTLPSMVPSPASITFSSVNGAAPLAQTLGITSSGAPALQISYTVAASTTTGGAWLLISPPSSGTTPGSFSVSVDPTVLSGLANGTYNGSVVFTATSSASPTQLTVPVTLNVTAAVVPTPNKLSFTYQVGGSVPPSQPVSIATGSASVAFTATAVSTGNWLTVAPTSGTSPGTINVSVNPVGLAAGVYNGTVTVAATGFTSASIPVTLTVSALTVTPLSMSFNYATGGTIPLPQNANVSVTNGAAVSYSVVAATNIGGPWLIANPTSGVTPSSFAVSISPTALAVGTYTGTITVSSSGFTSQVVNVTLTVAKAKLTFSGSYTFSLPNSSAPVTTLLTISSSDGSAQPFTVAAGPSTANWLTFSPTSGTTPATIKLTANPAGLAPGVYPSPLIVTAPGTVTNTTTIPVQLTVTGSNLTANPATLSFTFQPGGAIPPPQTIALTPTVGNTPITLTLVSTNVSWLKVTAAASAPANIQVTVLPSLLTPATYTGDVTFTAQGSPSPSLVVPVTLTVSALELLVPTPATLSFNYQLGSDPPAPQSFALAAGDAVLNFTVSSPGSWLVVNPVHGATPGSVMVTADPTGLAPGTYGGTITATAYGATNTAAIPVTLTVSNAGQLEVTPSLLSFTAAVGGLAPAPQMVAVSTGGAPVTFAATSSTSWLTVNPAAGATPATIAISANPAGLLNGTYIGSVIIAPSVINGNVRVHGISPGAAGTVVTVSLKVGTGISATGPTIGGVINAASGVVGTVSPGMAISIFGAGLGPKTGVVFALPPAGGSVATTLSGTQVLFDGAPAPILFTLDGQVNALAPFSLAGKGATVLQVAYNGVASVGVNLLVAASEPGLFTANSAGTGQGAILNSDSSVNKDSNPAEAGKPIVLYGTGGGLTLPPSTDGEFNPLNADGKLALPVTVMIGGQSATVQYYGPAPGLVAGIIQVNAVIPLGTPSGPADVVLAVGGVNSQTVTVAVQ